MSDLLNAPFILAILLALTVHEWAHALVANALGDPTAKREGRLTLNPIAHLDFLGTVMFFLVHFGWGKPVPIDPRYFKHFRRDTALVSIAGPVSNFMLAIASFFLLLLVAPQILHATSGDELLFTHGVGRQLQAFLAQVLANSLFLNLALMAFNLLPIAPLDGSKILQAFVPARYDDMYDRYMHYGPMILLGLIVAERALNISILTTWVVAIIDGVLRGLTAFV